MRGLFVHSDLLTVLNFDRFLQLDFKSADRIFGHSTRRLHVFARNLEAVRHEAASPELLLIGVQPIDKLPLNILDPLVTTLQLAVVELVVLVREVLLLDALAHDPPILCVHAETRGVRVVVGPLVAFTPDYLSLACFSAHIPELHVRI